MRSKERRDFCKTFEEYEELYLRYLVRTWIFDPTNFRRVVDDVEAFIDLKDKICPPKTRKLR